MTTTAERGTTDTDRRADWVMSYVEARIMARRGDVTATQIAWWEAQGHRAWHRHHPAMVARMGATQ
jgi:hypothetical protein